MLVDPGHGLSAAHQFALDRRSTSRHTAESIKGYFMCSGGLTMTMRTRICACLLTLGVLAAACTTDA
jgi:hypothetical protein